MAKQKSASSIFKPKTGNLRGLHPDVPVQDELTKARQLRDIHGEYN